NLENTKNDIALYIGVTVGIFFVSLLSFFLTRLYWKKNRHQSLYNMASNGQSTYKIK
ncbi:hypothetical protein BDFB_012485, partial [Asbolus verrucosus]